MFVTNHVLSGVLIGGALPGRPVTAFVAGLGSHLMLDACPHWGCDRRAPGGEERFLTAARRDGLSGLAVMATATLAVDRRYRSATVAAMVGAALLDLDKPFRHFFGFTPWPRPLERLHTRVQNESADGMRNELAGGAVMGTIATVVVGRARRVELFDGRGESSAAAKVSV